VISSILVTLETQSYKKTHLGDAYTPAAGHSLATGATETYAEEPTVCVRRWVPNHKASAPTARPPEFR